MTATDLANLALSKIGEPMIEDITDTGDRVARLALLHYEPTLREVLRAHFWGFAMVVTSPDAAVHRFLTFDVLGNGVLINMSYTGLYGGHPSWSSTGVIYSGGGSASGYYLYVDGANWKMEKTGTGVSVAIAAKTSNDPTDADWGASILAVAANPELAGWVTGFIVPPGMMKLFRVMTPEGAKIDDFAVRRVTTSRCVLVGSYDSILLEYVSFVDDPDSFDPLFVEAFVTLLASKLARAVTGSEAMEAELRQIYETNALPTARTADSHDTRSAENRPLDNLIGGSLLRRRGDFMPDIDEI